jgi:hypothetical protein
MPKKFHVNSILFTKVQKFLLYKNYMFTFDSDDFFFKIVLTCLNVLEMDEGTDLIQ